MGEQMESLTLSAMLRQTRMDALAESAGEIERLRATLSQIMLIEEKMPGGDRDEIRAAKDIAAKALGLDTPSHE